MIRNIQCERNETEVEKINLNHTIANIKETNGPAKISLELIIDNVLSAKSKRDQDKWFTPNLFIGSGRGGAVCAGIFASHYGQPPFKVVDCQFSGKANDRITEIDSRSLRQEDIIGKNILVIE